MHTRTRAHVHTAHVHTSTRVHEHNTRTRTQHAYTNTTTRAIWFSLRSSKYNFWGRTPKLTVLGQIYQAFVSYDGTIYAKHLCMFEEPYVTRNNLPKHEERCEQRSPRTKDFAIRLRTFILRSICTNAA